MVSSLGKMHNCYIIHTDIKPGLLSTWCSCIENVMFYPIEEEKNGVPEVIPVISLASFHTQNLTPDFNHLCLIDFGSVSSYSMPKKGLITTRTYRAPEVILDLEWGLPCDMWSLGCMAYELGCGKPLFQTHHHFFGNREHLGLGCDGLLSIALITKLLGKIPQCMLDALDPVNASMFNEAGELMWPPPVTREIPEEKQPGGWASNDISWNARVRAIRAVRTAKTSIEYGVTAKGCDER